jgi:hypothetical protein
MIGFELALGVLETEVLEDRIGVRWRECERDREREVFRSFEPGERERLERGGRSTDEVLEFFESICKRDEGDLINLNLRV